MVSLSLMNSILLKSYRMIPLKTNRGAAALAADASTVWKEFTTAEGKKYYYKKDTKQSKWNTFPFFTLHGNKTVSALIIVDVDQPLASASSANGVSSSSVVVIPITPVGNAPLNVASESSSLASPLISEQHQRGAYSHIYFSVEGIHKPPSSTTSLDANLNVHPVDICKMEPQINWSYLENTLDYSHLKNEESMSSYSDEFMVRDFERERREEVESGQGKDAKQTAATDLISRLNNHGSYSESDHQKGLCANGFRRFCANVVVDVSTVNLGLWATAD
ncbi:pre-mRNA-processing protein 40A [Artemisia annua]|uniref:Pre-mRNA-processing protein 40A n=1 Tax=Artemisia annua TaxID=35608 RepID=A0A2U1NTF7_ARTAN|nr:pre-mRNA-processing protein 40A [Artemisia annua]